MFAWDDIRLFLAIERNGSLPEAAKELKLAHSTVFRRFNAFEEKIGTRLFDRTPQGFVLTAAGQSILDMAQDMEDRSEQIARTVGGHDYTLKGKIRVTTTHGLSLTLMQPVFKDFTEKHPEIRLDIQWGSQVRQLSRYEADVIILPSRKPPENAFGRKVGQICFGLFASRAYLKNNKVFDAQDLSGHKIICLDDSFSGQPFFDSFMQRIQAGQIIMSCSSFLTAREAILSGAGIGLLPLPYTFHHPELEQIGAVFENTSNDVWILTHKDLKNTVRIRTFMDFAYDEIHKVLLERG